MKVILNFLMAIHFEINISKLFFSPFGDFYLTYGKRDLTIETVKVLFGEFMANGLKWTLEDIKLLRHGFTEKQTLKQLSFCLNRTPSAINKALTRFKIRNYCPQKRQFLQIEQEIWKEKYKHWKNIHDDFLKQRNVKILLPKATVDVTRLESVFQEPQALKISLSELVNFLKSMGYSIQKKVLRSGFKKQNILFLNHKPTTEIHLLVTANMIRLQAQQPIFELMNHVSV